MKLGILCPIGPLDRFGYQHHYHHILRNLTSFGNKVYLCSSTRNRVGIKEILSAYDNVVYIGDEESWFELGEHGDEYHDIYRITSNVTRMMRQAQTDGMDCAVSIHISQYVPDDARPVLLKTCDKMIADGRPYDWLYKKYQLYNTLFHTDVRVPWILNLAIDNPYVFKPDSIEHAVTGERIRIESGDFSDHDHEAIVDCNMERTPQDLEAFKRFTRFYIELTPQAPTEYDWEYILAYYSRKFNTKTVMAAPLDSTGQALARESRPNFVSHLLLERYVPPVAASAVIAQERKTTFQMHIRSIVRRMRSYVERRWVGYED